MKYYYLDSQRNICGPYSEQQLCALLLRGTITRETLCAAAGQKSWKPLSELSCLTAPAADCPPPPAELKPVELGNCAVCGTMQQGVYLLPQCPSCGTAQAAKDSSMWSFFCLALRRLLSFRGRSQRKEYWSWVLFNMFFFVVLAVVSCILYPAFNDIENIGLFAVYIDFMLAFTIIFGIIALLYYPLMVRRLHDINLSGWWMLIPFCMSIYSTAVSIPRMIEIREVAYNIAPADIQRSESSGTMSMKEYIAQHPEANHLIGEVADDAVVHYSHKKVQKTMTTRFESQLKALQDKMNNPFSEDNPAYTIHILITKLSYIISILIIVVCCIDSKRGANKYGPSSKYPRG